MQYLQLFLFEIILGYLLQSAGSIICLYAFSGKKIKVKPFLLLTLVNAVAVYAIRQINIIAFGVHTLLIMIVIIFLGIWVVKASINVSAISALITMVTITVSEITNYLILRFFYDEDKIKLIMGDTTTLEGEVRKAIAVLPSNVFFIVVMVIIFIVGRKRLKDHQIGKISETNS